MGYLLNLHKKMGKVTFQQALNAVKHYDLYYQKNRSENHLSSFAHAIQESAEDFSISDPNFYHMYLVCECIIDRKSNRSNESIVRYCKSELAKDIHYWNFKLISAPEKNQFPIGMKQASSKEVLDKLFNKNK